MAAATAPLAPGYRERPWWWEAAPPPAAGPPRVPAKVDVAVVGGGYTGMAAARALAERGRSVVVFERDPLGTGASTRNGGMVHPGLKHDVVDLLAEGPQGRALWDASVDAFEALEKLVAEQGIECHYRRTGHVVLAHRPEEVARLRRSERVHRDELGDEATFVGRDELAAEIGSPAYHGGLVVPRSGGLHPALLFAGVAGLAARAGAQVADRTAVTGIERRPAGGFTVVTSRGTVTAGDVLVATNAWTGRRPSPVPWLRRRILPVGSYIIATEPLPPEVAAEAIPRGRMLFDTRNFLRYWRLSPDGRMLFGGRTSFARTTVATSRDRLHRAMATVHPALAGVPVTHAWGGLVALTYDRLPHVGRVDGVAYAMGWCGTGVALSNHVGRLVGAWMAEGGPPPPFTGRRWPRVPAPGRAPWLLPVAGWYYRARDRFG